MKQFGKVLASLVVVALGYLFLSTSSYAGSSYGFSFGYNSGGGCSPRYYGSYGYGSGGYSPRYYGGASYSYSYCAPQAYYYSPPAVYYYAPPPVYYSPSVIYRPCNPRPTYYYSGGNCYKY